MESKWNEKNGIVNKITRQSNEEWIRNVSDTKGEEGETKQMDDRKRFYYVLNLPMTYLGYTTQDGASFCCDVWMVK